MAGKEVPDSYNVADLTPMLDTRGFLLHYIEETPSTMLLAEAHIKNGNRLPAVFLANHQTQGQGREGRVWTDRAGASLLVSVGMQSEESLTPVFADLVALRVCRTLRRQGIDRAQVKYPNDIVVDGKKAGGILVKNVYDGDRYLGTNIGIGLNVHYTEQEVEGYGKDYPATALDVYTPAHSRATLLIALLEGIKELPTEAQIFTANRSFQDKSNELWREYSSVLGKKVQIESDEAVVVKGSVMDTQIGRGILINERWFSRFDTSMKVRVIS